jgi:hypothetical protein
LFKFAINEPYAKTRSDADGNFSIKRVPGGAILISAQRLNEHLRWFLWLDSLPAEKVSFSSHNLYGGDHPRVTSWGRLKALLHSEMNS